MSLPYFMGKKGASPGVSAAGGAVAPGAVSGGDEGGGGGDGAAPASGRIVCVLCRSEEAAAGYVSGVQYVPGTAVRVVSTADGGGGDGGSAKLRLTPGRLIDAGNAVLGAHVHKDGNVYLSDKHMWHVAMPVCADVKAEWFRDLSPDARDTVRKFCSSAKVPYSEVSSTPRIRGPWAGEQCVQGCCRRNGRSGLRLFAVTPARCVAPSLPVARHCWRCMRWNVQHWCCADAALACLCCTGTWVVGTGCRESRRSTRL